MGSQAVGSSVNAFQKTLWTTSSVQQFNYPCFLTTGS